MNCLSIALASDRNKLHMNKGETACDQIKCSLSYNNIKCGCCTMPRLEGCWALLHFSPLVVKPPLPPLPHLPCSCSIWMLFEHILWMRKDTQLLTSSFIKCKPHKSFSPQQLEISPFGGLIRPCSYRINHLYNLCFFGKRYSYWDDAVSWWSHLLLAEFIPGYPSYEPTAKSPLAPCPLICTCPRASFGFN